MDLFSWLKYIFIFILILLCAIYWFQDRIIYYPSIPQNSRTQFLDPKLYDLQDDFEEIFIKTEDGISIQNWLFHNSNNLYTILFFHGNAGNLSHRLENIYHLFKNKFNVMIVSYRGYGKSQGFPNEKGMILDSKASLNYLIEEKKINPENIILFGRSLGGAVGLNLSFQTITS